MKYGKKIETYSLCHGRWDTNSPKRMNNPLRAEQYDFTTRIPQYRSRMNVNFGGGWRQIHRFFESRIGQQWNKVWAEFCGKASVWWMPRDTIGNGYSYAMICTNAYIQGGVVCGFNPYSGAQPLDFNRGALFVHPRTGQLCGAKTHARKQKRALRKDWQSAPIQS